MIDSIESGLALMALIWLLVALAALDAEHQWLPDFLTLPGICIGLLVTFLFEARGNSFFRPAHPLRILLLRVVGILAAAGLILLIRWIYWLIRRREGIGLGDAKLMAMLAAWLGLPGALLAFGLGAVLGAIAALVLLVLPSTRENKEGWAQIKLPLGTFLCVGGIVSSLWGERIIDAYRRWAGF
jgi:leader peptidase (prepilin peptidase)/N-methyltransferase